MKMDKDFLLHGNNARTGGKSKQELSRNSTNTAVKQQSQPFDAEFAKKQVDEIEL
jgi:hypothetical protein